MEKILLFRVVLCCGTTRRDICEKLKIMEHCADVVQIPGEFSLNVSVAGSIVLYDRLLKNGGFGVSF